MKCGDDAEAHKHAAEIGEALLPMPVLGLFCKGERFQRENREHAWHQVENGAAKKGEEDGEADARNAPRCRRANGAASDARSASRIKKASRGCRVRPPGSGNHVAGPLSFAFRQNKQAIQLFGRLVRVALFQVERKLAARNFHRLRGGVGNGAPSQRKKARLFDALEQLFVGRDRQPQRLLRPVHRIGCHAGQWHRQSRPHFFDLSGKSGGRRGASARHGQRELNMRLFRNADLPADEVRDFRAKGYAIAFDLLGDLNLGQEHDLIVISVFGKRPDGDDMGDRPQDRPS